MVARFALSRKRKLVKSTKKLLLQTQNPPVRLILKQLSPSVSVPSDLDIYLTAPALQGIVVKYMVNESTIILWRHYAKKKDNAVRQNFPVEKTCDQVFVDAWEKLWEKFIFFYFFVRPRTG